MFNQSKFPSLKPKTPEPNPFDSAAGDLKQAIDSAKEILVLIRDNPKLDHVASALALYLALKKAGKSVTIACPTQMRVEFNRLVAVDKIASTIGNRNLVVSFPYVKDSIEKVSYNVDQDNFNLVIQPKPGFPSLDSSQVSYSYSGVEADLVFMLGCQKLEDLGVFYQAERQLFESAQTVNLDTSFTNTKFAQINLVWSEFSSLAEIVSQLIETTSLALDQDIASNLLSGLNDATQNFQRFNIKPKAFEVAAKLMQAGGKRPLTSSPIASRFSSPRSSTAAPFASPSASQFPPRPQPQTAFNPPAAAANPAPTQPSATPLNQALPSSNPSASSPAQSRPAASPQPTSDLASSPAQSQADSTPTPQPVASPQPTSDQKSSQENLKTDWLKPKIYKGSTKV